MPGTRTAPDVSDATNITGHDFSMRYIDYNGDKRSVTLTFVGSTPPAAAELEAVVAATQVITNASIYECRLTALYSGAVTPANALPAPRISVYDNVVVSFKDQTARDQFSGYVPAPIEGILTQAEQVNITEQVYIDWRTAMIALFPSYVADRARFTERIERNPSGPA